MRDEQGLREDDVEVVPDFLRDLFGVLPRHWLAALIGLSLGIAMVGAGLARYVPRYSANASILVTSQGIPEDLVRSTVRDDPFARLNAMVGRVLTRNQLAELISEFGLYPALAQEKTMADVTAVMSDDISITPREVLGNVRRGEELSRVFDVRYESADPETASAVANRLASLFVEAGLETRMERASSISSFLKRQLEEADTALRAGEAEIAAFKETYRGELPSEFEANQRRLERLQDQRQSLAIQIAEAESRIATIAASEAADQSSPTGRLTRLEAELEQERATHTDQHPNVRALVRQITAARIDVAKHAESGNSRSALAEAGRATVEQLRAELALTRQQISDLDQRVANTPRRQERLAALDERVGVVREEALEFMRKVNEAELAESLEAAQQGASIKVLDRAQTPTEPTHGRGKLLVVGIAGALGLACFFALFLEFRDPVLVSEDQVERLSGAPVLGSVPRLA